MKSLPKPIHVSVQYNLAYGWTIMLNNRDTYALNTCSLAELNMLSTLLEGIDTSNETAVIALNDTIFKRIAHYRKIIDYPFKDIEIRNDKLAGWRIALLDSPFEPIAVYPVDILTKINERFASTASAPAAFLKAVSNEITAKETAKAQEEFGSDEIVGLSTVLTTSPSDELSGFTNADADAIAIQLLDGILENLVITTDRRIIASIPYGLVETPKKNIDPLWRFTDTNNIHRSFETLEALIGYLIDECIEQPTS